MRVRVILSMKMENVIANLEKLAEDLQTNDECDSYAEQVLNGVLFTLKNAKEEEVSSNWWFSGNDEAQQLFRRIKEMPLRDRLESVAEEAAEVGQAALKFIRSKGLSENPTPVDGLTAWENLCEEITDLCLALEVSGFDVRGFTDYARTTDNPKLKRWVDRLENFKKTEETE